MPAEGRALRPCQSDTLGAVPSLKPETLARAADTRVLHQGWRAWHLLSTQAGLFHLPDFLFPVLSSLTGWAGSGCFQSAIEQARSTPFVSYSQKLISFSDDGN